MTSTRRSLQIAGPRVSPDGKSVAFIEGLMSDEGPTGGDIFVLPVTGGTPHNVTPQINSSPSAIAWTAPDRITFAENIDGESGLATVSATEGPVQQLWHGEEFIGTTPSPSASFSRDGAVTAEVRQSAATAPEVWAGSIDHWKQITTINNGIKPAWGELRNFHWTNGNTRLQGWLMLPKDFDATQESTLS